MARMNRRTWLGGLAGTAGTGVLSMRPGKAGVQAEVVDKELKLNDFQPRSMLRVNTTLLKEPRFPVIDVHTHLSWMRRESSQPRIKHNARIEDVLALMDRKKIRIMVNLTGGYGSALEECLNFWQKPHPDRFLVFVEPWFDQFTRSDYPRFQAEEIEKAAALGARGLKLTKALGLYLREGRAGPLVAVDDKRFDPMWEAAGSAKLPVAIHTSDPEAFFLPIDRYNERYEELNAHPDWSFHGRDFPSSRELHAARTRVIARHPKTEFLLLHVGISEDLETVSSWLDRYPNVSVEIGARIGELGRQPRASRKFFEKYQDRILFGTDAVPEGHETPQQVFVDELYEIYYRFLETEDEYFDYAPAKKPPQGRWNIYGLGLPESILKKVYHDNAARLLHLT